MRITGVESTDLFTGTAQRPLQIIRVTVENTGPGMIGPGVPVTVRVDGAGVSTPAPSTITGLAAGEARVAEVPVEFSAPHRAGSTRPVSAAAETGGPAPVTRAQIPAEVTV